MRDIDLEYGADVGIARAGNRAVGLIALAGFEPNTFRGGHLPAPPAGYLEVVRLAVAPASPVRGVEAFLVSAAEDALVAEECGPGWAGALVTAAHADPDALTVLESAGFDLAIVPRGFGVHRLTMWRPRSWPA